MSDMTRTLEESKGAGERARLSGDLSRDDLLDMYRTMALIRYFETQVGSLFRRGLIYGTGHQYSGQEAVAVGVCKCLDTEDYVLTTHRGHGHIIAKGGDLKRVMAELMGRDAGYCHGKGGSMHIAAPSIGLLGACGIVGGGLPIAVGAALSARKRGTRQIVVSFHGDGATNEGAWHESLNFAALYDLPVLFVCENNCYGQTVAWSRASRCADVAVRAQGYGMPGAIVDGQDVIAVYEATKEAVARAREGKGPTLLECKTYRFAGHWFEDDQSYRTRDEVRDWEEKQDPIVLFGKRLVKAHVATPADLDQVKAVAAADVEEAIRFGVESPEPNVASITDGLFTE